MSMESQENSRGLRGWNEWMGVKDAASGAPGCIGGRRSGVEESWV